MIKRNAARLMWTSASTGIFAIAIVVLAACAAPRQPVHSSALRVYGTDPACQAGVPFVNGYDTASGKFNPQLESARRELNSANDEARSRSALLKVAAILDAYDQALAGLTAPASESAIVGSVLRAGEDMGLQARTLAAQPAGSRDLASFAAAVRSRTEAAHALALRITLLRSECE